MKLSLILMGIFLASCAQLKQGQMQPVIPETGNAYFTTCSGAVEDWGSCNRKAKHTCNGDYEILHQHESAIGGRRELRFTCSK